MNRKPPSSLPVLPLDSSFLLPPSSFRKRRPVPPQATPKKPQVPRPTPTDRQLCVVRYSPDGKVLAAGDYVGGIVRWDASGDKLQPMEALAAHSGWLQSLAFHSDGKTLFSADSWGRLCAWPFAEKSPKPIWNLPQAHAG